MKHCTYCGKEYPDDVTDCPLDGKPVEPPFISPGQAQNRPEVEMPEDEEKTEWVTVLHPHDQFEADIVLDRLRLAGFNARPEDANVDGGLSDVISGTLNPLKVRVIQVERADYEKARELLDSPLTE